MKKLFMFLTLPLVISVFGVSNIVKKSSAVEDPDIIDETFIGADFSSGIYTYVLKDKLPSCPNTIEAWIRMGPLTGDEPGGVIFSNYEYYNHYPVRLEVNKDRQISLLFNKGEVNVTFDNYFLPVEKWTHVAVTRDTSEKKTKLYINGELKNQIPFTYFSNQMGDFRFIIGGDWTNWHEYKKAFKGEIASVAVYSVPLNATSIKKDYLGEDEINSKTRSNLLFSGDLSFKCQGVVDKSAYHNDASIRSNDLFLKDSLFEPKDYSMFVIPDPQIMTHWRQENLDSINKYIISKKDLYNVQMTMCVGDNADGSLQWDFELPAIRRVFTNLTNAGVRWATTAGNHDYDDNCTKSRSLTNYNRYFSCEDISKFDYFGGFCDENESQNAYYTFETEGVKYLIVSLEFGTTNHILDWADSIIGQERFQDHRVIVFTHAYLGGDGERLAGEKSARATSYGFAKYEDIVDADDMFNKVIRKHKNVFMVFSGHVPFDDIVVRRDVGDHGNTITQMLIDSQGLLGGGCASLISLLTFDELNQMVYVNYANTMNGDLFDIQNQFSYSFKGYTDILSSKYYDESGNLRSQYK